MSLPTTIVASLCFAAASAAVPVVPEWDADPPRQGHACVDASTSHQPGHQNNTRWTFWAAPEGAPPSEGWPVYVEMLSQPFVSDMFPHQQSDTCGDPPPPPYVPPSECAQLLNSSCPLSSFAKLGEWRFIFSNSSA